MPVAPMRVLKSSLEHRTFDRAYLFHGEDDFLKEEKVRALVERATDAATRDFNFDVHRGPEADAGALGIALDALPMMAERRLVLIRDVAGLRKEARAVLERYLERPAADTVVLVVAAAGTKPDDVLLERTTAIEFRSLTEDEVAKWITQRAESLGVKITAEAVRLLGAAGGNELALVAGELDKARDFAGDGPVDEAAVAAVAGVRHGETLGDLLDRVAARDGAGAATLLERVLGQPKTSGVSVVMALTTQMLAIGWGLAARERGVPRHQLPREFYALLGDNRSSVVGRPWGEAVSSWTKAVEHWDHASTERALELLRATDVALKDVRASSDEQVLTSLLLAMTARVAVRSAA